MRPIQWRRWRPTLALAFVAAVPGCHNSAEPEVPKPGLMFILQPPNVDAGYPVIRARVALVNMRGTTLPGGTADVTLSLATGDGRPGEGAVLSGATTQPTIDGVASFEGLSISRSRYLGYFLIASAPGFVSGYSTGFGVSQGPVTHLGIVLQPRDVTVGSAILLEVVTLNIVGDRVSCLCESNVSLTLTPGTGTAGAVLGGGVVQPVFDGHVSFGNITVDRAGVGYTLTATLNPGVTVTSAPFTVTLPPPAKHQARRISL